VHNLNTTRALGLDMPAVLIADADEVVECFDECCGA
jgi:hypothetical protein